MKKHFNNKNSELDGISFYPNPANNKITILSNDEIQNISVLLFNSLQNTTAISH